MTVRVLEGDCRDVLKTLPAESVHCVVTSPPYWGLRDYGVAGQLGLQETPQAYTEDLVAVFEDLKRVLRNDGTLWLNLGDSYASTPPGCANAGVSESSTLHGVSGISGTYRETLRQSVGRKQNTISGGLKPKDLVGIPWRVAFALQEAGWWLRQDIIWSKPNPMPESVRDRCTKAHEYIFLLAKSERYYFDADSIAEEVSDTSLARWSQSTIDEQRGSDRVPGKTNGTMKAVGGPRRPQAERAVELARAAGLTDEHIAAIRAVGITDAGKARTTQAGTGRNDPEVQKLADEAKAALGGYYREFLIAVLRNKRSVWTVTTQPFKEAHFATFPPALIEPCILAGCPAGGTVLDPFGGAGTTGLVADRHGRSAILIELNPEYAAMARRRITNDAPLFAEVS